MLDRIGLLQPRLALAKRPDDVMAADALRTCAWAATSPNCSARAATSPMAEPVLRPVLDGLARYFRDRSSWRGGQKTPEFLAQIDRALAGVAGAPAGSGRARPRGGGAGGHPPRLLPRRARVPTRPSPPGGPRIMIGEFNLYGIYFPWLLVLGVVTLGVAWALRRLLARPACTGWWAPGAVRPRAVRGAALRRHPDISLYFPETRMKIPNALRPAAIGKFALTAAVVAAAVAAGWQLGALRNRTLTRDGRVKACGAGRAGCVRPGHRRAGARQPGREGRRRVVRDRPRPLPARLRPGPGLGALAAGGARTSARDAKRNRALGQLVAAEALEQSQTKLQQTEAALAQAEVQLNSARLNLERSRVLPPPTAASPTWTCAPAPTPPPVVA